MLGVGLSAEALIFLLSAFAPKEKATHASVQYPVFSTDDQYNWMHYMHPTEAMTHTLNDMNGLYKKSLGDTSRLYDYLNMALKSMEEASSQAVIFKKELTALNEKITALNDIYTKTLNAFKR